MRPTIYGTEVVEISWSESFIASLSRFSPDWVTGALLTFIQWVEANIMLTIGIIVGSILWTLLRIFLKRKNRSYGAAAATVRQFSQAKGALLPIVYTLGKRKNMTTLIEDIPSLYKNMRTGATIKEDVSDVLVQVLEQESMQENPAVERVKLELEVINIEGEKAQKHYNKRRRLWNLILANPVTRILFGTQKHSKIKV